MQEEKVFNGYTSLICEENSMDQDEEEEAVITGKKLVNPEYTIQVYSKTK